MIWKIRGGQLDVNLPRIMGVLNLTPDSFSDGGKYNLPENALRRALELIDQGADILDLGAESTKPQAKPVSESEELARLLPVLEMLLAKTSVFISVDTTKPTVARECLKLGAHIINDVSGLKDSGPEMAEVVKQYGAGLVLMHRRGNPETMQSQANYENVTRDVLREMSESVKAALDAGIDQDSLAVDPGLGFAKTAEQNIELIRNLEQFQILERPIVFGPSRKSFLGKITGRQVDEREFATAACIAIAYTKGVQIFRVHEVGWMKDVLKVTQVLCPNSEDSMMKV